MDDNSKEIPQMNSYAEIGEFWDDNDLADYWDKTEPAEFTLSPNARRRYLIAIEPDLLKRLRDAAHKRGVSTESLINLFLEQRLVQV